MGTQPARPHFQGPFTTHHHGKCPHWPADAPIVHPSQVNLSHLSRLGAQTIARFLACMLVWALKEAMWTRCFIRNSRVLQEMGGVYEGTRDIQGATLGWKGGHRALPGQVRPTSPITASVSGVNFLASVPLGSPRLVPAILTLLRGCVWKFPFNWDFWLQARDF